MKYKLRGVLVLLGVILGAVASSQNYQRVVSLAPSITKNIDQLNARKKLVGCTNYCIPAKDEGVEVVASIIAVNLEKVLSLKPDLILATGITTQETIDMLRKFDVQVEVFQTPRNFEQICEQYIRMGKLLGEESAAKQYCTTIRRQVDSLRTLSEQLPAGRIFFQIGVDPLFTVLPNTFMDDFISFLNGTNIATMQTRGTITQERVLSTNPDHIFIATMGILGQEQQTFWQGFREMSAVKENQIFLVDPDLACTPTPQTFLQTLQIMYNQIHR